MHPFRVELEQRPVLLFWADNLAQLRHHQQGGLAFTDDVNSPSMVGWFLVMALLLWASAQTVSRRKIRRPLFPHLSSIPLVGPPGIEARGFTHLCLRIPLGAFGLPSLLRAKRWR